MGHIDLTVRIGELLVSISGPSEAAQQLLREITSGRAGAIAPAELHSRNDSGEEASTSNQTVRLETRDQIESTFPVLPADAKDLARHLSGAVSLAESRVARAWKAGCWAAAVLADRIPTPNRSEPIELKPRIYVVLRAEGLASPACFSSSRSYFRAVGSFQGQTTSSVSHSFPSETEARIYCRAAGVPFPEIQD